LAWILQDFILQQFTSYVENLHLLSTLTGRTILWELTIQAVSERPWLGFGHGVFRDAIGPFALNMGFGKGGIIYAHNAWLDAAFTSGYPGLAVFVLWFVYSVVVILRALRIPERDKRGPKSFLLAMAVFILARSFTEGGLNLGTDFQIFAGLGFLAEAGVRRGFREGPVNPHPLPAARR
jgi:O-antigen ligase